MGWSRCAVHADAGRGRCHGQNTSASRRQRQYPALLGSVKHSDAHFVSAARGLGKYAVLTFLALCKLCVMLCHPRKDIDALSYINDLAIQ